jgi:UDP-glucose:(heptosyl)LPS alpha-1,3-glucosyltransferase
LKIAIVRKKYNPFGGAERYLHLLAGHLLKEGHEVHIFANRWPAGDHPGLIFHQVPMVGGLSLLKIWSFAVSSWWKLRRFDGDLVFSNERLFSQDIFRASDGVHRTWLKIRMQHLSWIKKMSVRLNPLHWTVRFFDRHIFSRHAYRKIIAPSEFIKQDILRNFTEVSEKEIHVIYNGVDLERFHPKNKKRYRDLLRRELGYGEKDLVLLFIGTGFERKGLRFAIGSLTHLPPESRLLVIGKGRTGFYRRLAETLGVASSVRFLGPVDGTERYYAASDILVLPTRYEPMANVVLEAMATGLPVVTSRHCGNSEVITEGRDGQIVEDPTDPKEIAEKINAVIKMTREEKTEIWTRGKAELFSLHRTITEMTGLLSESASL